MQQNSKSYITELIVSLIALNLIDIVFTVFNVCVGNIQEANPLMRELIEWGILSFVTIKTTVVLVGVSILHKYRSRHLTLYALLVLNWTYLFVVINHFYYSW